MKKDIDIREILKSVPKGTQLYSTVHGVVGLWVVADSLTDYPILLQSKKSGILFRVTGYGKLYVHEPGECILFPSDKIRDWNHFGDEPNLKKSGRKFKALGKLLQYLVS